jgi:dihydroorotase
MKEAGAVAFTDDGSTVSDDALMAKAMTVARSLNVPIMDHALDPALAGKGVMHDGAASARLKLPGIPSEAETRIVRRDIDWARRTGCAVHIQHVSAKESVELIRKARQEGIRISGEITPHHLALCDADVPANDANFKMSPPLRSASDREALMAAVADGTVQVLATDHAPHRTADKARGFLEAPFGVLGLESAIGLTYTLLVRNGKMSAMDWVRRWTLGPAHVLGMEAPSLAPGRPADLAILDLSTEWIPKPEKFLSRSRNTPFGKQRLVGQSIYTLHRGQLVWNARR